MSSGGGPGKAVMPAPGQSVQFRASLWSNLEKLMDDIFHVCVQTSHLHKVWPEGWTDLFICVSLIPVFCYAAITQQSQSKEIGETLVKYD